MFLTLILGAVGLYVIGSAMEKHELAERERLIAGEAVRRSRRLDALITLACFAAIGIVVSVVLR